MNKLIGFLKKTDKKIVVLVLILTLIIINSVSETKNIKLSDEFFDVLESVDYSNTEKLSQLGFEKYDDYYILHNDKDDFLSYVAVYPNKNVPKFLKKHGNISYDAEERKVGILHYDRLLNTDIYVSRVAVFYKDDFKIYIVEDNTEKSEVAFEKFIIENFTS